MADGQISGRFSGPARFLAAARLRLAADYYLHPRASTGEDLYSTRGSVMAAGEGRSRRRGTARGSRSVAASGGEEAAAA